MDSSERLAASCSSIDWGGDGLWCMAISPLAVLLQLRRTGPKPLRDEASKLTQASALAHQFVAGKGSRGQGIAFVLMTFIYNFVFSACIGPLSWV